MLTFDVLATEGLARRGRLTLNHGVVETPIFMPVGESSALGWQASLRWPF